MDDTSKLLSQDEIDSMLMKPLPRPALPSAGNDHGTDAPKPASAGHFPNAKKVSVANISPKDLPQSGKGNHHEECIAAGDINNLHGKVDEIMSRLSLLELAVSRMENAIDSPAAQGNSAAVKAAIQQVQNVSSQVEVISEGLRGTAGYNISKVFNCGSCGSVGVVAIKVKCTKCGQENWWGWWPKKTGGGKSE